MWLFALFVAIPLIEIALFIQVGGAIGFVPNLGRCDRDCDPWDMAGAQSRLAGIGKPSEHL